MRRTRFFRRVPGVLAGPSETGELISSPEKLMRSTRSMRLMPPSWLAIFGRPSFICNQHLFTSVTSIGCGFDAALAEGGRR